MTTALSDNTIFCLSLLNAPTSRGNFSLPGISEESTKKLVEKLKVNYINNNAFFDGTIFHNHVMDHLIALWSMGGTSEGLDEVYATHDYEDPVKPSPQPITDNNFAEHLGDSRFYSAYITYFCQALAKSSVAEVLDRFLLSTASNVAPNAPLDEAKLSDGQAHPEMLTRVMAGVLHPWIHIGYGAEFGIAQQVAEGLAQAAIHRSEIDTYRVPLHTFNPESPVPTKSGKSSPPPFLSFHQALAVDPRFSPAALDMKTPDPSDLIGVGGVVLSKIFGECSTHVTQLVTEWYDRWTSGVSDDELEARLEKMVEDITLGNVFWYGVSGYAGRGQTPFNADFLAMHFVTSSIFLPTLVLRPGKTKAQTLDPPLPLASRLLLARTFLATCATWYIARYRPTVTNLSIDEFYAATNPKLTPKPALHAYASGAAPSRNFHQNRQKTVPVGITVWPRIFQNAAAHPNEHLIKIVRAFGAFDLWYGQRPAGTYGGAVAGAEKLDGTFFLRAAILTLDRLGWAYEEEELNLWDRMGFYLAATGDDAPKS